MQDNLRFVSFFDLDMMDLKALGRFRQKTIKQRTRDVYKRQEFVSSTEKFDTSTPMGRAMLNICIVFAQLERETIQKLSLIHISTVLFLLETSMPAAFMKSLLFRICNG